MFGTGWRVVRDRDTYMRRTPDSLSTETQPPLATPLRHFVVGLLFLLLGLAWGAVQTLGGGTYAFGSIVTAHLLLVGWVLVTILGAMSQFVPVWSGVELYSERLAMLQLGLVAVGVGGFTAGLAAGQLTLAILFAVAMAAGVGVFLYNLTRTLLACRPWDVTERRFALALVAFGAAAALGVSLAVDFVTGTFPIGPVGRLSVVNAHLTLAVFGGVLTTVTGALYQLGPMFTQTDPTPIERRLRRLEGVIAPLGVMLLALGWLSGSIWGVRLGGLLVGAAAVIVGGGLLRQVWAATVDPSPMLTRYLIVGIGLVTWGGTAAAAWISSPLAPGTRFGWPDVGPVLLFGAIAFVVIGTLYHVIPFLIWVHRYSDRLGFEPVPMIDDLYNGRIAQADFAATLGALLCLLAVAVGTRGIGPGSSWLVGVGVLLALGGAGLVVGNLLLAIATHAPDALGPGAGGQGETRSSARE